MRNHAVRGPRRARRLGGTGAATAALAIAGVCSACSLQGLDDLTPPYLGCAVDADCEPLNVRDGLAPVRCGRWECVQSYCRLQAPERPVRFDSVPVLTSPADLHELASADRGLVATFLPAMVGAPTMFRADVADASPVTAIESTLSGHDDCGDHAEEPCLIAAAATAGVHADLHVVAAHVRHPSAPVWIGPVTSTHPDIAVLGPAARSSIGDGVVPSPAGAVRALSIAASPFDRNRTPQALAAMVVTDASPSVQAIGLWIERDADEAWWAHGTSADGMTPGTPDQLGPPPRDGDVRPAVVGLGRASSGWLIAYPTSASEVALVRIAPLAEPASCATAEPPCVVAAGDGNLVTRVAASGERASQPLAIAERRLAVGELSGDVALAAAAPDPTAPAAPLEAALAYRSGEQIVVALALVDGDDVSVDLAGARRLEAPGVRELSVVRVEGGLSTGARPGGYVLTWSTSENTYVATLPDGAAARAWALDHVMTSARAFTSAAGDLHVGGAGRVDGTDRLVVIPRVCDPTP